jgi:ABC-type bacteriocin/lantibiotic exporter with double-glycine peptidase domain
VPRRIALLLLLIARSITVHAEEGRALWLDVPFVTQPNEGCGAASIAMVMHYWSRHSDSTPAIAHPDVTEILHALHSDAAHGIYASDMVRFFEQNGFRTFAFAGQRADLEQHLAKGRPLIAALKPGAGLPLHYVVVAGLDPQQHVILLNDPAQRKLLKEDDARFAREWKAAGNWTLLALPVSSH